MDAEEFGEFDCVFPAYAGMFLHGFGEIFLFGRFPRIRGDVPENL